MSSLPTFEEAWSGLRTVDKKSANILLGNGFSLGAHPGFAYGSLYDKALERQSISELAQRLFKRYGTNNFERVLNQLEEGEWLATQYELKGERMRVDLEEVKTALIEAIAAVHPGNIWDLGNVELSTIGEVLSRFKLIATVNYDLVLYWVLMNYMGDIGDQRHFEDGFRPSYSNRDILAFRGARLNKDGTIRKRTVCYLHGALHFARARGTRARGTVVKRRWGMENGSLIEQARDAIEGDDPPLFVAEGTWEAKRDQIADNEYLAWALERVGHASGVLFTYGWAMNDQDRHILDAIHANDKLKTIFVGVFDDFESKDGLDLRGRAKEFEDMPEELRRYGNDHIAPPIEVKFYDARSMPFWQSVDSGPFD